MDPPDRLALSEMRILSLLRRSALPSARNFGVVGRAALPLLASVQQPVSSLVAERELAAARKGVQPSFNMVPIVRTRASRRLSLPLPTRSERG